MRKIRFIVVELIACAILAAALLTLYLREKSYVEQSVRERQSVRVEVFSSLLINKIRATAADVLVVAKGDSLREFVSSDFSKYRPTLTGELVHLSQGHPEYDQIRILDLSGLERLRINSDGKLVPLAELQSKASRDYFRKAAQLGPDELYLSAFDLNVENGVISRPLKPMLRVAVPIFDTAGRRRAVLVINLLGSYVLEEFQRLFPENSSEIRVLNQEGYWLRGATGEDEWGFALAEHSGRNLSRQSPLLWADLLAAEKGQSSSGGGLFTWRRVLLERELALSGLRLHAEGKSLIFATEIGKEDWNRSFCPPPACILLSCDERSNADLHHSFADVSAQTISREIDQIGRDQCCYYQRS